MPHPDQKYPSNAMPAFPGGVFVAPPPDDLAREVAALRHEIAELKELLAPVPSLIATGRDVLEQFKRLKGKP